MEKIERVKEIKDGTDRKTERLKMGQKERVKDTKDGSERES